MALTEPLNLSAVLGTLKDLRTALDQELNDLIAVRGWAMRHCGADFVPGDRVRIRDGWAFDPVKSYGWACYRECLVAGAPGRVSGISFSERSDRWYTHLTLDREWSLTSNVPYWPDRKPVRHWHGPVAQTPEGYEPPTRFDQENYPDGRKHSFMMWVEDLRKIPADGS